MTKQRILNKLNDQKATGYYMRKGKEYLRVDWDEGPRWHVLKRDPFQDYEFSQERQAFIIMDGMREATRRNNAKRDRVYVMPQHEDDRPRESHEFFVRRFDRDHSWEVEIMSGREAAMQLGFNDSLGPGVNVGHHDIKIILDNPEAMTRDFAQGAVFQLLIDYGVTKPGSKMVEGKWSNFRDHPYAEMIIRLGRQVREMKMSQGAEPARGMDDKDIEELWKVLDYNPERATAAEIEMKRQEDEAVERGLKVIEQYRSEHGPVITNAVA